MDSRRMAKHSFNRMWASIWAPTQNLLTGGVANSPSLIEQVAVTEKGQLSSQRAIIPGTAAKAPSRDLSKVGSMLG